MKRTTLPISQIKFFSQKSVPKFGKQKINYFGRDEKGCLLSTDKNAAVNVDP